MRDIFIYCDVLINNYTTDIDFYSYMNCDEILDHKLKLKLKGYNFNGKLVHTNYLYWLAKNRGHKIHITTDICSIPSKSVVLFHHDNYFNLKYRKDLIYAQVLSDKPLVPYANYYITNSKAFLESKKFNNVLFLPEPLPAKNLNFTSNSITKSPENFRFLGIRNNFPDYLTHDICTQLQKDGINIIKDFSKNFLDNSDDVFFFLRKDANHIYSCKHSNRIFLSYITEIPFIGSISNEDELYLKDVEDVIPTPNSRNELLSCFYMIKRESVFREYKEKLSKANKEFYKNYFFNELDKLISYFQTL